MKTRIGHRLLQVREERKLSQTEMADLLGLSQSSYSRLERNEATVELEDMVRYAKTLGVPVQDFLPETLNVHYENHQGHGGPNMIFGDYYYFINTTQVPEHLVDNLGKMLAKLDNLLGKVGPGSNES